MEKTINKYYFGVGLLICLIICEANFLFAQDKKDNLNEVNKIFKLIEKGINDNSISSFSEYFGENTFLSLKKVTPGYFSINQVHYVLKDFLSINQPVSFRFNNIILDTNQPYATGVFVFSNKGRRDSAMIFISLKKVNESWRISQISIN